MLSIAVAFLLPLAIPGVGLDYNSSFFLITVFVLLAWFIFRWDRVKGITQRSGRMEILLGASVIAIDYAFNTLRGSSVGVLDLLVVFLGTVVAFYGLGSLKLFWVPAAYGIVLLIGYEVENVIPNLVALQDWLASVMASVLNAVGISSTAAGELVSMNTPSGTPILLDVQGTCTGLEGILAFGLLSTMTLLDLKPKMSRVIPIFAIGFAGAFLTNILRLLVEFLTYEYAGADAGLTMHVYFGYFVFIAWVVGFWAIAFRYLVPMKRNRSPGSGGLGGDPNPSSIQTS